MLGPEGFPFQPDEGWVYGGVAPTPRCVSETHLPGIGVTAEDNLSLSGIYTDTNALLERILERAQLPDSLEQRWRDAIRELWDELRSELAQGQIDTLQAGDVLFTLYENTATAYALLSAQGRSAAVVAEGRVTSKTLQVKSNLLGAIKNNSAKSANPKRFVAPLVDAIRAECSQILVWSSTSSAKARSLGELCLALAVYQIHKEAISESASIPGPKAKTHPIGSSPDSFVTWLAAAKADVLLEWLDL
jgi:hypothetical protein